MTLVASVAHSGRVTRASKGQGGVFYTKTDCAIPDRVLHALRATSNSDLGLSQEQLTQACTRALGAPPLALEPLHTQGTFHRLFLVEGRDRQRYVLRVNALSDTIHDLQLHVEAMVSQCAAAHGIPVAEVTHVDTSRTDCPFDYALVRWVPGENLGAFDHDDNALAPLLGRLGSLVARLHGVELSRFGPFDTEPYSDGAGPSAAPAPAGQFSTWTQYLWVKLDAHVEACIELGVLDRPSADRTLELFETARAELDPCPPALLHGDLGNHNVMTDGNTVTALLDWEDCLVGDPIYDVAFWATFHPERRHRAFIDAYRQVRALPQDFRARFWLYFLRVALAKTVHRHRFGYTDRPGREPASRRVQLALERLAGEA